MNGGMVDYEGFIEQVRVRTGLGSRAMVETAVRAVTEALGALIDHAHRDEIAAHFPSPIAQMLRGAPSDADADASAFLRRVAGVEHLPAGFAVEHATAILETIGGALHPSARRQLASRLPEEMRDWIEPRRVTPAPPLERSPQPAPSQTLAEGHPGSRHPLSEAAPPGAQSESVASRVDPHANSRLSSAAGMTQEREHEDLAEGHPGPRRPLSEAGE
jgi:uncharacterized protein (DUF2267 family)